MPKFNEFIKSFEEKETAPKAQEPKVQTAPNVEGQGDHKVTQTFYNLSDKGEWEQSGEPKITMANKERVGTILSDNAQPFEQSHRLYKQGKGKEKFDTYESISPDGKRKSVWSVEFPQAELGAKQEQPAPQKQEENVAQQNNVPQQKSEFKPTEPIEEYDDLYGALTNSEREFNLETSNDRGMYEYVEKNLPTLQKLAETNPERVIRAITAHGNYPRSFYGIEPKNIRKEYVQAVLNGFLED